MEVRKCAYFLILLALIVIKVSSHALHVYIHHGPDDEHEDECELCEYAIYSQNTEFSTPTELHIDNEYYVIAFPLENAYYTSVLIKSSIDDTFFGRPPPSLV